MISDEQERLLTESKFWKPEYNSTYRIIFRNWRYEEQRFKDNVELRPALTLDLVNIDGTPQRVLKTFSSTNKMLNLALMHAIRLAEHNGRDTIYVQLQRLDKTHYHLADLTVVGQVINQPIPIVPVNFPGVHYEN